jgi:hypothetical protein
MHFSARAAKTGTPTRNDRGGSVAPIRALLVIAVLAGLLVGAPSAAGQEAGYNKATKKLEAAFKVASSERISSEDGCYPPPEELAAAIGGRVAATRKAIKKKGIVHVIEAGTNCNRVQLAVRTKSGTWVLDSATGTVVKKQATSTARILQARASGGGGKIKRITKSFRMSGAGSTARLTAECGGNSFPLGGGISSSPGISADGAGVYPHSYERLGVQHGWHVTTILLQPGDSFTEPAPRRVTMQVVCGPEALTPDTTLRRTLFLREGTSPAPGAPPGSPNVGPPQTGTATCPKGEYLLSGGFQRTNFTESGGSYVTESRAVGSKSWRVSGRSYGKFPGELVALAYCIRNKGPLLRQRSASTSIAAGAAGTVKTRRCPKGRVLTSGGFSLNGSHNAFIGDGSLNANDTWSQSAYGFFGPAQLTAYGYCL